MKKIVTLLAVFILLMLPACQAPTQVVDTAVPAAEIYPLEVPTENAYPVEVPSETNVEETHITVDYAKNFTLEYKDGYKLLTVLTPWAGATEPVRYALVPKGQADPTGIEGIMVVHTPIESFV